MTGLYILIKYLTFPGALMRGMLEQITCRLWKTPVEDNRYLRKDEMVSHIEHELMEKPSGAFAICFGPALMNLLGAFIFALVPTLFTLYARIDDTMLTAINLVAYWFSVSLFTNAFPLIEDAMNMTEKVYKKGNILQKIIYTPGVALTYIGAYLERYCLTFLVSVIFTVAVVFFI